MIDKTRNPRLDRDTIEKTRRTTNERDEKRDPILGAPGSVADGLAGKVAGVAANPTEEDAYWREHYSTRSYTMRELSYDVYAPAYRYGWEAYALYPGRKWEDVESYLSDGWKNARGMSPLDWEDARGATKDAWERVDRKRADRTRA